MKKLILWIAPVIIFSLVWSTNALPVAAKTSEATKQCFDAKFYAETYPDVVKAYGKSEKKLLEHYLKYGRYEGRSASAEFNLAIYRNNYADLNAAFGNDLDAYPEHYRQHGKKEGRNAKTFDPSKVVAAVHAQTEGNKRKAVDPKIGNTYVEIDLDAQHLYLVVDGEEIMDTAIVTGDVKRGRSTPTGTFSIYSLEKKRYLSGPGYKVWVEYWMPFNGGIGLHDAAWRSKFGGEIYKKDGSHGCINMPRKKAKTLFKHAYIGMPVVCH
ncbi:MAG: L,D-transpeptidase [Lachnospiraceae bacterium]|jgi:lipoprotein-anchoring transpeptidase ErfK/SrfK|nr:L,D-transpeptidase [Lachnospiraceae bacterium]